ncbi:hypothetical protein VTJ04DRAFT_8521 [Mycothermus thermophilus]|uniref:uncharacterized protein n=1 Tax=Humicola insolens TaxID=85995 RepID=UPI0037429332
MFLRWKSTTLRRGKRTRERLFLTKTDTPPPLCPVFRPPCRGTLPPSIQRTSQRCVGQDHRTRPCPRPRPLSRHSVPRVARTP